jgi:hypothetical protein
MGTRHLIAAKIDGVYKLAQYGQWDGYPEGQGVAVLDFLVNEMDMAAFTAALRNSRFIGQEEVNAELVKFGADPNDHYTIRLSDYDRFSKAHPEWSRDTGAKILSVIQSSGGCCLRSSLDFAADSLFCEWAYVLDFDTMQFEVYVGYNKTPLTEKDRFFFLEPKSEDGYHPVRLLASWPMDALPQNADDFLAAFPSDDEEEEDDEDGEGETE